MQLTKDFKEFLGLLNENSVKYLIIGEYAVGIHGYPRYTGDIDIWVGFENENVECVINALEQFGIKNQLSVNDLNKKDQIVQLGYPPQRIDILTGIEGNLSFDECFNRRLSQNIDGLEINVISIEDLKKNKEAVGRNRDLNDLENLP